MKTMKVFLLVVLSLIVASCASVSQSEKSVTPKISDIDGTSKRVLVTNYGYYLFNCIPILSGGRADGEFELFADNVNQTKTMEIFKKTCEQLGATEISNIQNETTSTCFFNWAPFETTFGLYWYRESQISASLKVPSENSKISTTK